MDAHLLQWHVTWSTHGRCPVAADEARRRALVRALADRAGPLLVLFALVDDHLHVWLLGERDALVATVRSIGYALRALAPVLAPHVEVVERRGHAEWLVAYLLTQTAHHGLATHPAAWTGSALPDLLGARRVGRWRPLLWEALPRLRVGDIHAAVGLPDARLAPATDVDIAALGVDGLVEAAAAAFAAAPDLAGRDTEAVLGLEAAARLARDAGLSLADLARRVGRTRESVSRAASRPVADDALRTVRLRIALTSAAPGAVVPPLTAWKERLALRRAAGAWTGTPEARP